jgi:hypothetical protein
MSKRNTTLIAVGCLLAAVLAGVPGAQATFQHLSVHTGLFTVTPHDTTNIHVSLHDRRGAPAVRVVLRLFDEFGVVLARQEASLEPGQSVTLVSPATGLVRANAEVDDPAFGLTGRVVVAGVEVIDGVTAKPRSIPTFNPQPIPGGRD